MTITAQSRKRADLLLSAVQQALATQIAVLRPPIPFPSGRLG
jgi:hypothetical protein